MQNSANDIISHFLKKVTQILKFVLHFLKSLLQYTRREAFALRIFVCLDDRNGMLFNHRRQSRDRLVLADLFSEAEGTVLWAAGFSRRLLGEDAVRYDDDCLQLAGMGECCFVEADDPSAVEDRIESITVYRWNRLYPADVFFPASLLQEPWILRSRSEFAGFSHETITKEVYTR